MPASPANVITTPVGVIARMTWSNCCETYTVPPALTATDEGELIFAFVPSPSRVDAELAKLSRPMPANDVTTCPEVANEKHGKACVPETAGDTVAEGVFVFEGDEP